MDDFLFGMVDKAESLMKELVEPLELFHKHYASTNQELIKQGMQFWNNLHQERTQMLFAKESYHN
jgi:hypothetical protein